MSSSEWSDILLGQPLFLPLENTDMQKINAYGLFSLGRFLGPIYTVRRGDATGDLTERIIFASAMLGVVSATASPMMPLTSCVPMAKRLEKHLREGERPAIQELSEYDVESIKGNLTRFEGALQSELAESPIYFVPPRGIYNTTALIDKAETVFSQSVLDRLPSEAIADLRQAGRALAFDLPTASGFHGCRATEAVIKQQVLLFSGSPAPNSNWGDYVRLLKLHGADDRVADSIHRMKEVHRNPLIHPEVTLTMQEAITLLSVCHSTIQACVADMERKNPTPSNEILKMLPPPEPPEGVA